MIRIISGKYKRRRLNYPQNKPELRPTKDMVKEALFSIIQQRISGSKFLDLCAGVGSIALEAISRGAQEVVCVDTNPKYIYENVEILQCQDKMRIYRNDCLRAIEVLHKRGELFDIVFIDPPYASTLAQDSLNKLERFVILKNQALVIVETANNAILQAPWPLILERTYGSTKLTIWETL